MTTQAMGIWRLEGAFTVAEKLSESEFTEF